MKCRAAVRRAVALLVRRQGGAGAQVGAHEQGIDDARRRPRVGKAFVTARNHARERECRPA